MRKNFNDAVEELLEAIDTDEINEGFDGFEFKNRKITNLKLTKRGQKRVLRAKIRHEFNFLRPYTRTKKEIIEHLREHFYPMSRQKMRNICCGYGIGAGNKDKREAKKKQFENECKKDEIIFEFYCSFGNVLGELVINKKKKE